MGRIVCHLGWGGGGGVIEGKREETRGNMTDGVCVRAHAKHYRMVHVRLAGIAPNRHICQRQDHVVTCALVVLGHVLVDMTTTAILYERKKKSKCKLSAYFYLIPQVKGKQTLLYM